jgi:hypothetical protein
MKKLIFIAISVLALFPIINSAETLRGPDNDSKDAIEASEDAKDSGPGGDIKNYPLCLNEQNKAKCCKSNYTSEAKLCARTFRATKRLKN